jgi:hypothetical protein
MGRWFAVLALGLIFGVPALWALSWLVPGHVTPGALANSLLGESRADTEGGLVSADCARARVQVHGSAR